MSTYSKTFGLTFINDDHFYANVAIIQNFFNGLCRILWGYGYDRFNFKICFMIITFVATLVTFCLPLLPCLSNSKILYFLTTFIIMFSLQTPAPGWATP